MMNQPYTQELLPQNDLLKSILADLRRTVREYTTATTEASCLSVRQLFTELTNSSLRLQGELYELMKKQQIYTAPEPAPRQFLDKKIQEAEQTQQEVHRFTQQLTARWNAHAHPANVAAHQPNVQPPYYN
ncbi:spore coat protein [Paenibacillus macerans]|uniref:spore coat protein n=1 Tax=Paenibacillus macerans TaxID=44252 RepID=UPI003D313A57